MQAKPETIAYCNQLKLTSRALYERMDKAYCSVLKEDVIFNMRGFHHLLYNSDGTARDTHEIIYKLTLLPLVKSVIKNATGICEERDIQIRDGRKKSSKLKNGKTYSLSAVVGRKSPVEVRVVLLRIGNGNLMFRSVMKH
jgi:hypothetical protein